MKYFKKDRSRYSFALIFSIVLHVLALSYIYKSTFPKIPSNLAIHKIPANSRTIQLDSIKFITPKQLQAIKDISSKQVVANELNGKKERPKESRFAGEADQTFDRQTMAAANGAFKKAGLGNKQGSETVQNQMTEAVPAAPKKIAQTKKAKEMTPKTLNLSDLGAIQISKVEEEEKTQAAELEEMNRKIASQIKKSAALGVERGSAETTGLARNNDFVEDVPLGDMTNLNTTEFKYYGFYHRIRQRLEQYWGNTIQSKAKNLYKSGRRLPASENLITAITVTLDDRGNIVDIKIDGTSGIRELDQAAVESFNKAGPFPNPPKGLLVGGRAVIQWGFVVKG